MQNFDILNFIKSLRASQAIDLSVCGKSLEIYRAGAYLKGHEFRPMETDQRDEKVNKESNNINRWNDYAGKQIGFNKLWP